MFNRKTLLLATTLFVSTATAALADDTYTNFGTSASWLKQIGVTTAVETTAAGGRGFTVAVVDTGVNPNSATLSGRVSASSKCTMTLYKCTNSFVDDNSHGTAVASILAGSSTKMSGVAPNVSIVAVKALNSAGSGSFTDVNSGIVAAANAGAKVINLSLTFSPDAKTIAAINYAASKGAFIVYAGGNSGATKIGSVKGLSAEASKRLVLVGSVNANNVKNTWSDAPGAGYKGMWLMAPGESIVAPGLNNVDYAWSGTSMAAPVVSGAVALLGNTWPILVTQGTAIKLLAATATDLGTKGVDNTYGQGLINLTAAFQPVGGLTVSGGGKSYSVTSLTPTLLSGGALGSLSSITSKLSNYTAFDGYARNFNVNLSGLAAAKTSTTGAQVAASAAAPTVKASAVKFADDSTLQILSSDSPRYSVDSELGVSGRDSDSQTNGAWMFTWAQTNGTVISAGKGFSPAMGFASALWGGDATTAQQAASMDVSNSLLGLAQGGVFAAYGAQFGDARIAFSFTSTEMTTSGTQVGQGTDWTASKANAASAGLTTKVASFWKAGFTVGMLNETDGLLGTTYDSESPISLGESHRSISFGTSHSFEVAEKTKLLVDGAIVQVSGATGNGLISEVSTLYARTFGASLMSSDVLEEGDTLSLSAKKPLRIVSGTATVVTSGVDEMGNMVQGSDKVSLVPDGNQTDLSISYSKMLEHGGKLGAAATYSDDAQNVSGQKDVGGMVSYSLKF